MLLSWENHRGKKECKSTLESNPPILTFYWIHLGLAAEKKPKQIEVLKFVPEINFSKIEDKKVFEKKLNIRKNYIFTPNQFWVHKNHICIIEA